jgi:prepilin-type N-terminal cleavage/methylation domain-containing protein
MKYYNRQSGFTFVELIVAMALGSMALLVLTVGIIRLFHMYQSGVAIRSTQQSARAAADIMSQDIRDAVGYSVFTKVDSPSPLSAAAGQTVRIQQDALCLFTEVNRTGTTTVAGLPGVEFVTGTGKGVLYHSVYDTGTQAYVLYRREVTGVDLVIHPTTQVAVPVNATVCANLAASTTTTDQRISNTDVSMVRLAVNTTSAGTPMPSPNPRAVSLSMTFAAISAQPSEIDFSASPNTITCLDTRFCSITQLDTSAGTRSGPSVGGTP